MSWPVFCEPPADMIIGPLPQLVSDENPAKFKTKKIQGLSILQAEQDSPEIYFSRANQWFNVKLNKIQ
jgi:hypothetical protein